MSGQNYYERLPSMTCRNNFSARRLDGVGWELGRSPKLKTRGRVSPLRVGRPRNRESRMNFSSQLAADVHNIIDPAVAAEGLTRRAVVELAIRHTWGSVLPVAAPSAE